MPISRPPSHVVQDGVALAEPASGEVRIYTETGAHDLKFSPADPFGWVTAATAVLAQARWSVRQMQWVPTLDGRFVINVRQVETTGPASTHDDGLTALHAAYTEWHDDKASSNDVDQALDDFLVAHGFPTVLYR